MKILLATGNHPRHIYLKDLLIKAGVIDALIIEKRENFLPTSPGNLDNITRKYFDEHFSKREEAEKLIFKSDNLIFSNVLNILPGELNSASTIEFIRRINPDLIITAGIGILGRDFLDAAPGEIWNIHGGLSPWYKGAITHFWPSYHLKPQFTGCTIHHVSPKIDAGKIIHHTPAVLKHGDGLHLLASRSLKLAFEETIKLITGFKNGKSYKTITQKTTGKLWLKKDWSPQHLSLIYGLFEDRIVDAYLEGKLDQGLPALYRQKL